MQIYILYIHQKLTIEIKNNQYITVNKSKCSLEVEPTVTHYNTLRLASNCKLYISFAWVCLFIASVPANLFFKFVSLVEEKK